MSIEDRIKDYIAKNLLFSEQGFPYADDASFLQEGIVDSVGIMELVAFIEDQIGVRVEDQEIIPDNFDSVARLASYVRRKNGQPA